MSDFWFPRTIKPLTNKSYSTSRGGNVLQTNVQGGLPRIALDVTLESPVFQLNFILSNLGYQSLLNFYDVSLNHGANSFKMNLDSGSGIVEHQCYIVPGKFRASKPSHNTWVVALSMIAEVTPSQLEDCAALYQLYDCHGEGSLRLINLFESFSIGIPNA